MTTASPLKSGVNKIEVPVLARIEGEGALHIKVKAGKILNLKLRIPEPPRLFEGFLRGRHFMEVPDITARICGVCPIANQMSATHALERALGIQIHPAIRALRRLFCCGVWIESHALHIHFLHPPDFLCCQDAFEVFGMNPDAMKMALHLKKIGNELVRVMGGREIHPVSACVGGFFRVPKKAELNALLPDLRWALPPAAVGPVSATALPPLSSRLAPRPFSTRVVTISVFGQIFASCVRLTNCFVPVCSDDLPSCRQRELREQGVDIKKKDVIWWRNWRARES